MRGFALLLTLALPALAAPLAAPEANSNAVALDTRNSVALRSTAAAAVERQLAPGGEFHPRLTTSPHLASPHLTSPSSFTC